MTLGAQSRRSKWESREELESCCYLHQLLSEGRDCAIYSCVSLTATITDGKTRQCKGPGARVCLENSRDGKKITDAGKAESDSCGR